MRSAILAFVLLFSLVTAPFCLAADASQEDIKEAVRGLTEIQVLMLKSTMSYEMLKLDQGNPVYSASINQVLERIKELSNTYRSLSISPDLESKINSLTQSVTIFLDELRTNQKEIAQGGYEQYALVNDMYEQRDKSRDLAVSIINQIKAQNNLSIDPLVQEGRDLANVLQTLSASYIEQSASVSGTALRGGDDSNISVDNLADDFTNRLNNYNPQSEKVIGLNAKVRDVKNKWAFLRSSMINFKTDTVPYLAFHYTDKMVDDLLSIADMYEHKDRQEIEAPSFNLGAA